VTRYAGGGEGSAGAMSAVPKAERVVSDTAKASASFRRRVSRLSQNARRAARQTSAR
jgi:hypothetical protein